MTICIMRGAVCLAHLIYCHSEALCAVAIYHYVVVSEGVGGDWFSIKSIIIYTAAGVVNTSKASSAPLIHYAEAEMPQSCM